MPDGLTDIAFVVSIWALPVLFAITLHEAAHAWVAARLGDPTAQSLGRVSFNPLRHVEPFGTVILPALLLFMQVPFLFGWAKPVPINPNYLVHPRRDMALVAAAGPCANLFIACVSAICIHAVPLLPADVGEWVLRNLINSMRLNLVLAILNMLPMPPLDGGRVLVGLLPERPAELLSRIERFGLLIVIAMLFIVPMLTGRLGWDFDPAGFLVGRPVAWLMDVLVTVFGLG